ncbi:10219_t:CDS:2 [Funneliformis geosporum]|nr:10219_t:CDS:2 [Funneliformis geosporum]
MSETISKIIILYVLALLSYSITQGNCSIGDDGRDSDDGSM